MPEYKHFPLADTAEGLTEADIIAWQVKPGDTVKVNQIVVEVETAKAAVELPIPWAGVVTELLVEPGQTVEVGTPILTIDVDPDGKAAPAAVTPAPAAAPEEPAEEEMKPLVGYGSKAVVTQRRARKGAAPAAPAPAPAAPAPAPVAAAPAKPKGGYVPLAKPPVRKLAKDLGVDLHALTGTADGGVITRDDVQAAANGSAPAAPVQSVVDSGYDPATRERRVPIKGVRKATAAAMVQSAYTAPHVTEFLTVDVTPMMEFREKLKKSREFAGVKVTPLTFAAKAVCLAAKRTPDVNAVWDEAAQEIVYKDYVHLGIAAATPRGLVVPKVRDADSMSLKELAIALTELTDVAREGKTTPAAMLGGTITITNVGVFGVDTGTPIINPGESAILCLGAIKDTPWVVDGEIKVRKVLQLSLSFDHRVVDGQQGSEFLADVGALLADPAVAITY
ncbi:dihydrolipoamide acetyltransferase family protein [Amycolatopsis regifaucium]|uniref:Dihydrolipoamide acetyltransferase component of pyruvate dehydrogenase complex n=1 Tax=Amycolatopsis regifaucium TaxID=546365 RepID=A0A154ML34_9PSEU|nr:dihydrolipoamide acetyltransferase family protein [Amycolatopsis regifaucium]KZB85021.1 branched-chain alpha-keto acid dehydrogenase subunit E2 [Amycolatopsis regifaucium]OKA04043.1 branched-chain alpha-keto acid dehydrogenase subunit E2 [Amycolatopsis regifaucium]SFH96862.1 pyruvate dehydrogenase E2 component (dihydrolipoamide acetyltransferase) [Amycolatopsis regifaucium]